MTCTVIGRERWELRPCLEGGSGGLQSFPIASASLTQGSRDGVLHQGQNKGTKELLFPETEVWDTLVRGLKGFKLFSPTSGQPLRQWALALGMPSALES